MNKFAYSVSSEIVLAGLSYGQEQSPITNQILSISPGKTLFKNYFTSYVGDLS